MKKLALLLTMSFMSSVVAGCGSQTNSPVLPLDAQQTQISAKKNEEKPVTKTPVNKDEAKYNESDFSKFAAKKDLKDYKAETIKDSKTKAKNGLYDYLPYRSFYDFERDIRYTNDGRYFNSRNGNYHFSKSYNAYEYAQNIYKASSYDMKRFIKVDMLANALEANGYDLPYRETHNPPFRPDYKILPTRAAEIMPTFAEIYDYNRYQSGVPYITWDLRRATNFYHDNYARYMGMIMEFAPTKYKAYDLIHREISQASGY